MAKQGRVYRTDEEKKKILDYVDEHGPIAAEKKFNINRSQIYNWRTHFGRSGTSGNKLEGKKREAKASKKSTKKKRLTAPESPMRGAAVTQARTQQRNVTQQRSRTAGVKALRHAAVLDTLANEAMNEDRAEEALALFAGASALRDKVTT